MSENCQRPLLVKRGAWARNVFFVVVWSGKNTAFPPCKRGAGARTGSLFLAVVWFGGDRASL